MKGRVLIVDDDRAMCELLVDALEQKGFEATARASAGEALAELETRSFDAVITDLNMRGVNGIELCRRIAAFRPDLPVVAITAFGGMESAVSAVRAGAYDFLAKPFELDLLELVLERAIRQRELGEEVKRLRRAVADERRREESPGASAPSPMSPAEARPASDGDPGQLASLDEVERRYILHVLNLLHGNKVRAARVLGLHRRTLYRKLDGYSYRASG